jgi:DNA-binding NarL/FixJ family response regulator
VGHRFCVHASCRAKSQSGASLPVLAVCPVTPCLGAALLRKLRVVLADDHAGFLREVRSLLKTDVEIVGCVNNGESLVEAASKLQPDVIVTDISMPKLNGIEAVDRLRESGCSSKVVFVTVHNDPDFVQAALKTGALGYVLKISIVTDLLFAIQEAFSGRVFISFQA